MDLSNQLLKSFAEVTNDTPVSGTEATVYGKIKMLDDNTYVVIDGSESLTPVTSTVKVSDGDRVIVSLKNHTATVTGNLTDPAASSITVDEMGVHMNTIVTFQNGLADGTTTINGGCIKTGTIDAQYLNLTGAIQFSDLSTTTVNKIESIAEDAAPTLPSYIKSTYIGSTTIKSPTIKANEFDIYTDESNSGSMNMYAYYDNQLLHMLEIGYLAAAESPYITFDSPAEGYAYWNFPMTYVTGNVDFASSNVSGLTATFG